MKAPTNKPKEMKRKIKKFFIRAALLAVEEKTFRLEDVRCLIESERLLMKDCSYFSVFIPNQDFQLDWGD